MSRSNPWKWTLTNTHSTPTSILLLYTLLHRLLILLSPFRSRSELVRPNLTNWSNKSQFFSRAATELYPSTQSKLVVFGYTRKNTHQNPKRHTNSIPRGILCSIGVHFRKGACRTSQGHIVNGFNGEL